MTAQRTIIFAGGGTAGHIHPALAVWEELREMEAGAGGPRLAAHFLCSMREVDARTLRPEGVEFTPTPANYPGLRPRQLWRFLSGWPASVRIARGVLARAKALGPVQLVTMGGFVAVPAVQAARVERVPVTLVNIDAVAGKANRLIARAATRAFTTMPQDRYPGWTTVAPLVRRSARLTDVSGAGRAAAQRAAQESLGLIRPGEPVRRVLLVTGGSLGARSLNALMAEVVNRDGAALTGWHVLHQAGSEEACVELEGAYALAGVPAMVRAFQTPLGPWWLAADLCLSRAGAGAVGEARATATPTLFLPYPHHADDHQSKNARPLVDAGVARVAVDRADAGENYALAGAALRELLATEGVRAAMRDAGLALARAQGPADGAATIARALLEGL